MSRWRRRCSTTACRHGSSPTPMIPRRPQPRSDNSLIAVRRDVASPTGAASWPRASGGTRYGGGTSPSMRKQRLVGPGEQREQSQKEDDGGDRLSGGASA